MDRKSGGKESQHVPVAQMDLQLQKVGIFSDRDIAHPESPMGGHILPAFLRVGVSGASDGSCKSVQKCARTPLPLIAGDVHSACYRGCRQQSGGVCNELERDCGANKGAKAGENTDTSS